MPFWWQVKFSRRNYSASSFFGSTICYFIDLFVWFSSGRKSHSARDCAHKYWCLTISVIVVRLLRNWHQFFMCLSCYWSWISSSCGTERIRRLLWRCYEDEILINNRTGAWKTDVNLFFTTTKSQKGQSEVKTQDKNARNVNFIKSDMVKNQKPVLLSYCLMERKRETFYTLKSDRLTFGCFQILSSHLLGQHHS